MLTLFLLSACAATPQEEAQAVLAEVMANHRASMAASGGAAAGSTAGASAAEGVSAAGSGAGRGGTEGLRPVALRPPAAGAGIASAAALLEQSPEAVLRALGPPALRRREGTAEVWLYEGGRCHLDLILYARPGGGAQVAWAAARAAGTGRVTEAACLAAIARRGTGL
ncbi:hypothetical protein LPC08_13425 [Roseomonas sp. OT10]|uniref:hypothetical protein n=1 Tax=Roseomonas cutis TaxID=2897332 RepID=UPI001E3F4A44|nr:hypothetical protein [Roseomonas sp. OT10]UFN47028.1 hypothetical protein LPC08_13425 [Roseomonas sp. OT10]